MVKKTITVSYDDLDGTEGANTHSFGLNGVSWEVDLTDDNFAKLEKALEPFVTVARRKTQRRRSSGGAKTPSAQIREWAAANDVEVPARGRIPAAVIEAYDDRKK